MTWLSELLAAYDLDGWSIAVGVFLGSAVTLGFIQLVAWWDLANDQHADQAVAQGNEATR
jgi:hypothetical protein